MQLRAAMRIMRAGEISSGKVYDNSDENGLLPSLRGQGLFFYAFLGSQEVKRYVYCVKHAVHCTLFLIKYLQRKMFLIKKRMCGGDVKHENDVNAVAEAAFSAEQVADLLPGEEEKGADGGKKIGKSGKKVSKSKGKKGETCKNSAKTPDKSTKTGRNITKIDSILTKTDEKDTKSLEKITKASEKEVQIAGVGEGYVPFRRARPFERRRYDDAAAFCEAVEGYFGAISYLENAREILGVNKLGEYIWGEPLYNVNGDPIILIKYAEPPSVEALCLYIGMPRSTWYAKQEDAKFAPIIEDALMRIDAYRRQVTIEDGKRSKGAQFLIQRSEQAAMAREQRKAERDARAAADGAAPLLSTEEKLRAIEDICKLMRGESVDLAPYTVEDDERDEE